MLIRLHFQPKGKDVPVVAIDGDVLYITKDSSGKARFRNEITLPDGTKRVMTDEEFAVKLRAETHIDEVAQVSKRGSEIVPDYKNHPFAKDGFNYRTAYFEDFDGSYYRLTLSVGINGEINTVYNVGKIKEARFPLSGSKAVRKNAGEHHASNDSIPQTASLSQENTGGNIFDGNVLPTAKEAQEQMQREQRAAKAETETERTGILLGVSDEVIREAVSVSKALDVDVVFYRRKGRRVKNDLGYYNHNDGKIYLNADIKNPASFILGHEMIHHIQLTKGYLKFADAVLKKIQQDGGDLDAMRKEIVDRYKENKVSLTSLAKIDQEVIAEYAQEHLFTNEADIISVVNADKETGHVIKRFLDNVLAKLGNKNARERAFVARARSLYAKALRENVDVQERLYGKDTARAVSTETRTASAQNTDIAEKTREQAKFAEENRTEDEGTTQTVEGREAGEMAGVEAAVSQNLRPEITENAELMQMISDKFGADGTEALVRQIQAEVERTGTVGKFGVLFSDGGRAVEEALGANDDGRQYSIKKEKGVAKRDRKRYNNLTKQQYVLTQSAILKKEANRSGEKPTIDFVYAADMFFLYRPGEGYSGTVVAKLDPEKKRGIIEMFERGLKDGTIRDFRDINARFEAYRAGKRRNVMRDVRRGDGRAGDDADGVYNEQSQRDTFGDPGRGAEVQSARNSDRGIDNDVQYAIAKDTTEVEKAVPYTDKEKQNWKSSKSIIVYENDEQLELFIKEVLENKNTHKKIYFGKIPDSTALMVHRKTGVDVTGHNIALKGYEVRKILLNSHGDVAREAGRGQEIITKEDLKNIPSVITAPDNVLLSDKEYEGKPVLLFEKNVNGKNYVVAYVSKKHHDISVQTMYKKRSLATAENANALSFTPETTSSTASDNIITKNKEIVKESDENIQYAITKDPTETETTTESAETTEGTDFWDEWLAKVEKYGAMPKGEKPARDIAVPKKIGKDKPVSQTVRTFQGTTARALT